MKKKRKIFFHVDVDSPKRILEFYQAEHCQCTAGDIDRFYRVAMERILGMFKLYDITATFFCVGDDLEVSSVARDMMWMAHAAGHELANHTYSHPFGLNRLSRDDAHREITRCSELIRQITGALPLGFRAPGYSISNEIIDILEDEGFIYDSSGFWSLYNVIVKTYHRYFCKDARVDHMFGDSSWRLPQKLYYPAPHNWQMPGDSRRIIELPLPRTRVFQLPFFCSFHLMMPGIYRAFAARTVKRDCCVYLFHLMEFIDGNDDLPREVARHPIISIPLEKKMKTIHDIFTTLLKFYEVVRTDTFISDQEGVTQ